MRPLKEEKQGKEGSINISRISFIFLRKSFLLKKSFKRLLG